MIMDDLDALVRDLTAYPTEEEWFEFKANWREPAAIGDVCGRGAYEFRENSIVLTIPFEFVEGLAVVSPDGSAVVPKFDDEFRSSSEIVVSSNLPISDSSTSDKSGRNKWTNPELVDEKSGHIEPDGRLTKAERTKEAIVEFIVSSDDSVSRTAVMNATGLGASRASLLLAELVKEGRLSVEGETRARVYRLASKKTDNDK